MFQAIERLRKEMKAHVVDAVLLVGGANRFYYSSFTGTDGAAFITLTDCIFFTDSRYTIQAGRQCSDFEVKELYGAGMIGFLQDYIAKNHIKRIWVDETNMTLGQYYLFQQPLSQVEFITGAGVFSKLRMVKTPEEIAVMKEAAKIAGQAYQNTIDKIQLGMSEIEIAREFDNQAASLGAKTAFIIVASGENSACPHNEKSERRIQLGDMLTIDFGVIYKGYNSDCTRSFAIGSVKPELERIYHIVEQAQATAAAAVKAGASCRELDGIARNMIADAGYGKCFGHSLGHSLGLDVHESPSLSTYSQDYLAAGMFITVEPGIYVENLGGVRIEDTLLVTENGSENITDFVPKGLYIRKFN